MSLVNTSGPVVEPVTTDELAAHTIVAGDATYMARILKAARRVAEREINQAIPRQTFSWVTNSLENGMLLPVYPLLSIDLFQYVAANGLTKNIAANEYEVVTEGKQSLLYSKSSWPLLHFNGYNRVKMTLTAGSDSVEEDVKQAIMMIALGLHENRNDQILGESSHVGVSLSSTVLLAPYKRHLVR